MREMFEVADKNHDNTVSLAELQAYRSVSLSVDSPALILSKNSGIFLAKIG